jgi:hypothetical protein
MSDASKKSIGFLIDELITTDLKCWFSQEDIMNENLSTEDRLKAAIRAQEMNDRRNQIIRAIDEISGQGNLSPTSKSYHTYFEKKG